MKKFEAPELEILMFDVMDVITASADEDPLAPGTDVDMGDWS